MSGTTRNPKTWLIMIAVLIGLSFGGVLGYFLVFRKPEHRVYMIDRGQKPDKAACQYFKEYPDSDFVGQALIEHCKRNFGVEIDVKQ